MMRGVFMAVGLLCAAGPLHAQASTPPDTALDAAHAAQRDAFLILRDSTSGISAASARLMSDLGPSASLAWLQSRARGLEQACTRSVGALVRARDVVAKATWPKSYEQKAQANMLKAMAVFHPQLAQCQKEWKAMAADTSQYQLRTTAPHAASVVQAQAIEFQHAAQNYLQSISVKLPLPVSGLH